VVNMEKIINVITNEVTEVESPKRKEEVLTYTEKRLLEYPSIQELVVALYDESDKASIIERRNAVKAKYPKPE